jgi:hypothetical protein
VEPARRKCYKTVRSLDSYVHTARDVVHQKHRQVEEMVVLVIQEGWRVVVLVAVGLVPELAAAVVRWEERQRLPYPCYSPAQEGIFVIVELPRCRWLVEEAAAAWEMFVSADSPFSARLTLLYSSFLAFSALLRRKG